MAPMLKRRKILDRPSSTITITSKFNRVSKPSSAKKLPYKKNLDTLFDSDGEERKHKPAHCAVVKSISKKRQREDDSEPQDQLSEQPGNVIRVAPAATAVCQEVKQTQRKKVRFSKSEDVEATPTKQSRTLLEQFTISTPVKVEEVFDQESQDLIDLHSAFVNALAIHYAHYGTASPIDLKTLLPKIELKWGKRRISVEDIQRILGVQQLRGRSALSLVQKTKTRTCIEYDQDAGNALLVETLKKDFLAAIKTVQGNFPLAEIKTCTPLESIFLSKGVHRLQEIKAAAIKAQPNPSATKQSIEIQTGTPATRATLLLDRIRNKEAHLSSLPAGPSAEALARKASLQRLEEIIPILEILSGSSSTILGRNLYTSTTSLASLSALGSSLGLGPAPPAKVVSFTMGNIMQHLQNSMKHPIAKEEVERAVRLLADEVSPRWVSVREMGSVVGVTFRGKIGRAEWSARLGNLLAEA